MNCNCGYLQTCNCCYKKDNYGFFSFVWDVFMVCITYGLWLIWIFVREMRKR